MKTANRKRNNTITIRMNDAEYDTIQNRIIESGLTQQSYMINAAMGATITSSDQVAVLKELSRTFADLVRQLRGLATNVNQMAHVANGTALLPAERELNHIAEQICTFKMKGEQLWQSIRSLINGQKATGP